VVYVPMARIVCLSGLVSVAGGHNAIAGSLSQRLSRNRLRAMGRMCRRTVECAKAVAVRSAAMVKVDVKAAQVEEEGVVAVTAVGMRWARTRRGRGRVRQGLRGVVARLALKMRIDSTSTWKTGVVGKRGDALERQTAV
jgi:hypothetical protein